MLVSVSALSIGFDELNPWLSLKQKMSASPTRSIVRAVGRLETNCSAELAGASKSTHIGASLAYQFTGPSRSRRPTIGDWPGLDCGSTLKITCCAPNPTL